MGMFSEVAASHEAKRLLGLIKAAVETKNKDICVFCHKHVFELWEGAKGESFERRTHEEKMIIHEMLSISSDNESEVEQCRPESPPKAANESDLTKPTDHEISEEMKTWNQEGRYFDDGFSAGVEWAYERAMKQLDLKNTTDVSSLVCARCGQFPGPASTAGGEK